MLLIFLKLLLFILFVLSVVFLFPYYLLFISNDAILHAKYSPFNHVGVERAVHFHNEWIIHIEGGPQLAKQIAEENGFRFDGMLDGHKNYYLLSSKENVPKSKNENKLETIKLLNDNRVKWSQQQFSKHLRKRYEDQDLRRAIRAMNLIYKKESNVSKYEGMFTDELWSLQWYEQDYRASNTSKRLDLNVVPVYQNLDIIGRNVNIIIIDDGIEYTHEDIKDSFDPELSYNYNALKKDIMPRYEDPRNKHGTRCAGELVMKPNNSKCGVGVCYGAKVGGVKLLDGETTDLLESKALNYALHKVDIYSGSWGPPDDGIAMDGPGRLSELALEKAIKEGRNGKGVIYVFAAGNGKSFGDNCGADGYINSIFTIAIASSREDGVSPFYSEACTGIHATTYSGGINDPVKIITTDVHDTCTFDHSGTSAAAPIAAGVLALALEANPNLTWRDAQHLLAWTSEKEPFCHISGWEKNNRNIWFHPSYGFGLVNAYKLVRFAKDWTNVPDQVKCEIPLDIGDFDNSFSYYTTWEHEFHITACENTENEVNFIEHTILTVNIEHPARGDVHIQAVSPSEVTSVLMAPRPADNDTTGFKDWSMLSLKHWGENPRGMWKISIADERFDILSLLKKGLIKNLQLTFYGTKDKPDHYKENRSYEH